MAVADFEANMTLLVAAIAALLTVANAGQAMPAYGLLVIGLIIVYLGLALIGAQATLRGVAGWLTWLTVAAELVLAASLVPHLRSRETA